jgi:uncharacterized protein
MKRSGKIRIPFNFLILNIILILFSVVLNERPPEKARKFSSVAVDSHIEKMKPLFKNEKLAQIYQNCFPNTLDTTVEYDDHNKDTFIITGDIEAMWLRDSSFQIFPYLKFAKEDSKLKTMMLNLIKRQAKSILIDPYANAFNKKEFNSPWQSDETYKIVDGHRVAAMNPKLWERKYELDSTISTLFFAYNFFKQTNDYSFIETEDWQKALEEIIKLVKNEMRGSEEEDKNGGPQYFFQREGKEPFDSLHQGRGNPVNSCGLVKSMFRNSDDATTFAYNIPENALLVSTFRDVASMLKKYLKIKMRKNLQNIHLHGPNQEKLLDEKTKNKINYFISELTSISKKVNDSIYENGIFSDPKSGEKYFAYEVDCFGNHYFLDDPGYPSLTALPFFDFISEKDPLYISTRKRILSNKNPYYFKGTLGDGLGSTHTERYFVWPLFTIMRGITATDDKEVLEAINLLLNSAEKTGFMHESFNINNPDDFTRSWFAWANSFFGYFINHVIETKPYLVLNK